MELSRKKLEGNIVNLEPIEVAHLDGLINAAQDPAIWQWMTFALNDAVSTKGFIDYVSKISETGDGMGFIIRCLESGSIIGGTGYWHIDLRNQKLEIGGSWLTPERQRSGANTESKYLLLRNAFENLGCKRVGFSIDVRNLKSLKAISKIGAIREGVLRNDMSLKDGGNRDSVIFSVINSEWPVIKERLELLLSK